MYVNKHTGNTPPPSPSHTRVSRRISETALVDTGVYLLALGGFYIGYSTLLTLALTNGFPSHQAHVVAALADLAILIYSWKAKQEAEQGRSAWGIRLLVATLSLATSALQIRAAWPHPTGTALHALAPLVWICGQEMMLRGKLRNAKEALRQAQIAAGLRPAPLARLRGSEWILSPYHIFQVWRLMHLWGAPPHIVKAHLARTWKSTRPVPAAWAGALTPAVPLTPVSAFKLPPQARAKALTTPAPATPLAGVTVRLTAGGTAAPADISSFLLDLPPAPAQGRSMTEAHEYTTAVTDIADRHGIVCTGVMLARLLDVTPGYITRITKPVPTTP